MRVGWPLARRAALDLATGELTTIAARAVGSGGWRIDQDLSPQQRLDQHGGRTYALALDAGAELMTWSSSSSFRSRTSRRGSSAWIPSCGIPSATSWAQALNGDFEEFIHKYGGETRAVHGCRATSSYAILKEVEAGHGSPHGGGPGLPPHSEDRFARLRSLTIALGTVSTDENAVRGRAHRALPLAALP